jgi:glucuronosyltransferase
MVETSKLFRDLPAKPLETAVWWTEYVLRHKQTPFLMPLAVNQTWYERRLLDVWGFITGVAVLILFLVYYIALTCLRIGRRGTGTGTPKRKDD